MAVFVKFLGAGSQDEYFILRGVNVEIIVVPLIDGVFISGGILVNERLQGVYGRKIAVWVNVLITDAVVLLTVGPRCLIDAEDQQLSIALDDLAWIPVAFFSGSRLLLMRRHRQRGIALGFAVAGRHIRGLVVIRVHVVPQQVADAIRADTALVTIMYANNEIGTVQPIRAIGAVCREKGVPFHTDAVQAVGHIPVNVQEDNIDYLSLSAHKFHGPRGVGVLVARRGMRLYNLIEGGAQERGKRAGTENLPAIIGMAAALEEAVRNMDENAAKVSAMRDRLIEGLSAIPHCVLNGDRNERLPGNVNFCFEGIEGESLLLLLDDKGVAASSGSACTSGSLDPSHVLLAIGRPHEIAHGSLRLTLCEENTPQETEHIIEAVRDVVAYLRSMSPVWRDLVNGKTPFVIP